MKGYSFRRVVQFARYHYISQGKNYLSLLLTLVGMPSIIGILSRDMEAIPGISMALYLFGGIAFALRTTYAMRYRSTKIMQSTMPVSNGERYTFMFFNLAVVFPLVIMLTSTLSLAIVYPFSYIQEFSLFFREMMNEFFLQLPIYIMVQIVCSASLLINLLARRNLFVAYLGAFVGVVAFFAIMSRLSLEFLVHFAEELDEMYFFNLPEWAALTIFGLVPVVFYACGYWALCKRQIKW